MVNNTLNQIDLIINKVYDDIKALDNDYTIETYTPEVIVERGTYGFNILPRKTETRFPTSERDMQNLVIDVYMHYDLEADDKFKTAWTTFMTRANVVLVALFNKSNFISGVSDVEINVDFDNSIVEEERIISLTFTCEYKIFASR